MNLFVFEAEFLVDFTNSLTHEHFDVEIVIEADHLIVNFAHSQRLTYRNTKIGEIGKEAASKRDFYVFYVFLYLILYTTGSLPCLFFNIRVI